MCGNTVRRLTDGNPVQFSSDVAMYSVLWLHTDIKVKMLFNRSDPEMLGSAT